MNKLENYRTIIDYKKVGKSEEIQLHHNRQDADGLLTEVKQSTHKKPSNALHPWKTKEGRKINGNGSGFRKDGHPDRPVDREKFDKYRPQYWKDRVKQMDKGKK